jgi:hypothetical protein
VISLSIHISGQRLKLEHESFVAHFPVNSLLPANNLTPYILELVKKVLGRSNRLHSFDKRQKAWKTKKKINGDKQKNREQNDLICLINLQHLRGIHKQIYSKVLS